MIDCSDYAELLKPKPKAQSASAGEIPHKKLEDIMKVELLADKTAEEITKIWLDYHKEKDVLVATIPTETFNLLKERSQDHPLFIFPLPRSQGYEFFLLQFASNTVHFTPLLCYQVLLAYYLYCPRSPWELISYPFHPGSQRECTRMLEHRSLHGIQRKAWNRFDASRVWHERHQCPGGSMLGQPIAIVLFAAQRIQAGAIEAIHPRAR